MCWLAKSRAILNFDAALRNNSADVFPNHALKFFSQDTLYVQGPSYRWFYIELSQQFISASTQICPKDSIFLFLMMYKSFIWVSNLWSTSSFRIQDRGGWPISQRRRFFWTMFPSASTLPFHIKLLKTHCVFVINKWSHSHEFLSGLFDATFNFSLLALIIGDDCTEVFIEMDLLYFFIFNLYWRLRS